MTLTQKLTGVRSRVVKTVVCFRAHRLVRHWGRTESSA
jgi:hypothetical protein